MFVRSSEIDAAGEMEGTVGDVARGLTKLAGAGIENTVVTSDHGRFRNSSFPFSPSG